LKKLRRKSKEIKRIRKNGKAHFFISVSFYIRRRKSAGIYYKNCKKEKGIKCGDLEFFWAIRQNVLTWLMIVH